MIELPHHVCLVVHMNYQVETIFQHRLVFAETNSHSIQLPYSSLYFGKLPEHFVYFNLILLPCLFYPY